jgi:xanthine dehydrogenase YagS FAD-binding subunit
MRAFEYTSPKTKEQVVPLLGRNWGEVEVLAGGTDLLSLMKDEITTPKRLVNIKEIADLRGITRGPGKGVRIGALVTLAEIGGNEGLQSEFPMLATAAADAASPQIRNLATLGGNLCQRPRCWYFRTGNGLLGQKDGKSLVLQGDNRYHAILGNDGPAYFVSPSTVAPVLIAYKATVHIMGLQGTREVPLEKFFVIPTSEQEREHDLKPTEFITEIWVPPSRPEDGFRAAQYEVRQKEAFDWPYATAAVALAMNGIKVESARVVLGHVAPIPWLSNEAAQVLAGQTITPAIADQAAQAAVAKAKSLGHNSQKIHLARVAVKRAILKAGGVA